MFEFANFRILKILIILLISSVAFSVFAFIIIFSWDYITPGQWLLLFKRGAANVRNHTLEKIGAEAGFLSVNWIWSRKIFLFFCFNVLFVLSKKSSPALWVMLEARHVWPFTVH